MVTFERCLYLKPRPIFLSMFHDKSSNFKQLFHFHPGVEMIYVHDGMGRLIIEQHIFEVKPGTLLFIKPSQPHYLNMNIASGQPYVRSLIKYEPHYFSEYLKPFPSLYKFHNYLWSNPTVVQVQNPPNPAKFERFLKESHQRLLIDPLPDQMEGRALFLISLFRLLMPLWKNNDNTEKPSLAFSPAVIQIMNWIDTNYDKEYSHGELAKTVHISPSHMCYLFQKETGKTITEFLTVRRLKQACLLLKTTTMAIQEVGMRSGWANFTYFCQVFKKNIGMTPKQYRRQ